MKKPHHIVLLAATYHPAEVDENIVKRLIPIKAPANYKDPVKIHQYIEDAAAKREADLPDVWLLRQFKSLHIRYFVRSSSQQEQEEPVLMIEIESYTEEKESQLTEFLTRLCDKLEAARDDHEPVQFFGIGVRNILRILAADFGPMGLAPLPYHMIADQRDVLDPMQLFNTDKTKDFDPLTVMDMLGFPFPDQYKPGTSCRNDSLVAAGYFNNMCRTYKQHALTI